MHRYKTNKQTLFIAALVILLCLVCLTGATLALFTSNEKDGTIGVVATAGNIGIDIVDTSPEEHSLVGQTLQFQTTSDQTQVLFEPGAVFRTQGFKIKNTGDIHVNFILTVSEDESVDMEKFHEAFEVWISTDPTSRSAAKLLTEFEGSAIPGDQGYLPAGESAASTYYLFVKMKETAGNDFQNYEYEGIGITVHAVQGNVSVNEGVTRK